MNYKSKNFEKMDYYGLKSLDYNNFSIDFHLNFIYLNYRKNDNAFSWLKYFNFLTIDEKKDKVIDIEDKEYEKNIFIENINKEIKLYKRIINAKISDFVIYNTEEEKKYFFDFFAYSTLIHYNIFLKNIIFLWNKKLIETFDFQKKINLFDIMNFINNSNLEGSYTLFWPTTYLLDALSYISHNDILNFSKNVNKKYNYYPKEGDDYHWK